jgi:hypothetical protein
MSFYISYIYKPATSSHIKPGLFEMTSLTWLPTDSWISPFRKSSYAVTFELELQQIPELRRFPISWFRRFMTSGLHRFTTSGASQVQDSRSSQVCDFELRGSRASDLRKFTISELHRFKIPDLHRFKIPENSFHKFRKTWRFEGDRFSWIPQQLGLKFFGTFTRLVVKVYNICRVFKTNRLAVLTVKSDLDPHMINLLEDEFKLSFTLCSWLWCYTLIVGWYTLTFASK